MKKQCLLILCLIFSITIYAQERAQGFVYDKESKAAVVGAEIRVLETEIRDTTDESGVFDIKIPEGHSNIIISKENYYTLSYILDRGFQREPSVIYIEPASFIDENLRKLPNRDSLFLTYKNAVSLSIIELFAVAIAIRYERFISSPKHSIGLHASYYVKGMSDFEPYSYGDDSPYGSTYTGFKAVPFYRFYPLRKKTMGLFAEAKIPFGYFAFDYIFYKYSGRTGFANPSLYNFWTWGAGISIGIMTRLPKSNQGILNFSVGYQYFTMPEPDNYLRNNGNGTISILEPGIDWWYERGPGGRFEVKLTIGGIF